MSKRDGAPADTPENESQVTGYTYHTYQAAVNVRFHETSIARLRYETLAKRHGVDVSFKPALLVAYFRLREKESAEAAESRSIMELLACRSQTQMPQKRGGVSSKPELAIFVDLANVASFPDHMTNFAWSYNTQRVRSLRQVARTWNRTPSGKARSGGVVSQGVSFGIPSFGVAKLCFCFDGWHGHSFYAGCAQHSL